MVLFASMPRYVFVGNTILDIWNIEKYVATKVARKIKKNNDLSLYGYCDQLKLSTESVKFTDCSTDANMTSFNGIKLDVIETVATDYLGLVDYIRLKGFLINSYDKDSIYFITPKSKKYKGL